MISPVTVKRVESRVRVYDDKRFLNQAVLEYPNSIDWPNYGMKHHYFLLAGDRLAFADMNEKLVSHGGISLEEVIVPFIRIREKNAT
jgi:hypothetical protein